MKRSSNIVVITADYSQLTLMEVIALSTGQGNPNVCLEWLANKAKQRVNSSCVACASTRPHLYTEPVPLHPRDTWGYKRMLKLTREEIILESWCNTTFQGDAPQIGSYARAGQFWYCGGNLHIRILPRPKGVCTMVQLMVPVDTDWKHPPHSIGDLPSLSYETLSSTHFKQVKCII